MNLKTNIANRSNYGARRDTSNIKYIVVHYTSNDGDTDENNGKYFKNNVVKSSAHYFVDDDSVTQSVPDNFIAYHCGAKVYKHDKCRNTNSIGVEICDDVKNGVVYPSAKTIANALEVVEWLMKKYNVPKSNILRHWDVTGKLCPAYWCGTAAKDNAWRKEFWNKIGNSAPTETQTDEDSFRVRVTAATLNIREGAGTIYPIVGQIKDKGVYTIVETDGIWGRLRSGVGWISLKYAKRL